MESCDFCFSLIRDPDADADEWAVLCAHTLFSLQLAPWNIFLAVILSLKLERKEFVLFGDHMQFFSHSHSATKSEGISPNLEEVCVLKWKMLTSAPNPFL